MKLKIKELLGSRLTIARVFLFFLFLVSFFLIRSNFLKSQNSEVKKYTFVIYEKQIQVAKDKWVTMWTYNGQVPGPTIRGNVGQTIQVTLINKTDKSHSIHSHGFDYAHKDDGTFVSPESIVPPGGSHTYTFKLKRAGFFYYHCHSEDQYPVSVHTQMGLYGPVIIDDPAHPLPKADKEEIIFFGEVYDKPELAVAHGCTYCTFTDKRFTIDARTYPLTKEYHPIKAKVGQRVRFYVVNIGNDIHSWHLHRQPQFQLTRDEKGDVKQTYVEGQTVSLVPAVEATIDAIMEEPGVWLFHCHVVPHADQGMLSEIVVEP